MRKAIINPANDENAVVTETFQSIKLKTATPLTIEEGSNNLIVMSWLCTDENDDLLMVKSEYFVDYETESSILNMIGFSFNSKFISNRITDYMIMSKVPNYLCDLEFSMHDYADEDSKFTMVGMKLKDELDEEAGYEYFEFNLSTNLFMSMKFIDQYIMDSIYNNHDLGLASTLGSKVSDSDTSIVIPSDIDQIVTMAPVEKKSGNIVVMFRVVNTIDENVKEMPIILAPFSTGRKLKTAKFKGETVQKIEARYFNDADHFIAQLMTTAHIKNLDKDYMILLGKTKNNVSKLFLFDMVLKSKLENMILDY